MQPTSSLDHPLPHEQIWIPMPDGARLCARLWRPAGDVRVPVVIEWIPYRCTDATAIGDSMMHGYFAASGIASLRIDIRGSGNSDGVLTDEYLAGEQDDAVAAIAWIAAQPWCNGAVGLIGISWGGFAALQIAARRPPALKAIVTACSTDDRYRDDVHYMGGCLLNDGISWGAGLFTQIARPPDPAQVGERWRQMWQERLEGIAPPLQSWLAHPARDAFWHHGSVCEDYGAIQCPVFAVGGWTDGYSDAILRLMTHLDVPRRGLIGPWTHVYPNFGMPGPAIGFLQECVAWWRRWLVEGEDPAAVRDETLLQVWIGEKLEADAKCLRIDGDWATLDHWPIASVQHRLHFGTGTLHADASDAAPVLVDSPQDCGLVSGEWCPLDGGGEGPEFQSDQRADDGRSLCLDTAPLDTPLDILGAPVLTLRLAMATPTATLVARLCEVTPDGRSSRITYGLLRLKAPGVGVPFDLELPIKAVGYRLRAGNRIRLALSNAYWPLAWPEPGHSPWRLWPAESALTLPLRMPAIEQPPPLFGPALSALPIPFETLTPERSQRLITQDLATGKTTLAVPFVRPTTRLGELRFGGKGAEIYSIEADDPASAQTAIERETWFERPGWKVTIRTSTRLRYVGDQLELTSSLTALEGDQPVFSREWNRCFPRDVEA